jgi:PPE family
MTARWRGHEHRDLYNMINAGPGAGASDTQNDYWASLTAELKAVDDELNKALSDMQASWSGSAADNANSASTPLRKWAEDAQSGSSVMHTSTVDQAEFVSTARHEMPKPVEVTTPAPSAWQQITAGAASLVGDGGPAAAVAAQSADHEAQEAAKEAAAQKAVDTMTTYESNSTWNRNTLGTFVAPPDVVVETAPPASGSAVGGPIGSGAGFGSAPGTREGSAQGSIQTSGGASGTSGYHAPPPPPGSGGSGAPGVGTGVGSGSGFVLPGQHIGTDPSFGVPVPPPSAGPIPAPPPPPNPGPGWGSPPPAGGYPVPSLGGLPGDPSGGGTSNLSNRPGGPNGLRGPGFGPDGGRPGAGGFGPGGLDADGGRSAAQLGRGGAAGFGEGVLGRGGPGGGAGARGGAGMPMGGGGYADGDEDDEHRTPGYLLETNDVFGDARMVSPAVIGEDPNSAEEK